MLRLCHPLREKKIEKWRISSFANFAYTKMKNNALAFNSTHWIHHEGLYVILLLKRLKCIGVSQTDIGHWLHLDQDQLNQFYIPNPSYSHTKRGVKLCCLLENACNRVVSRTSQTKRLKSNGKSEILYLLTCCSPTQISKEKKDEKKYFDEVTFCLKILFILLLA